MYVHVCVRVHARLCMCVWICVRVRVFGLQSTFSVTLLTDIPLNLIVSLNFYSRGLTAAASLICLPGGGEDQLESEHSVPTSDTLFILLIL